MAFINNISTIIKNSYNDIYIFRLNNNNLLLHKYLYKNKSYTSYKMLTDVSKHLYHINIDNEDNIYGIKASYNDDILSYFYLNNDDKIHKKDLFQYDHNKYYLIYPYIFKSGSTINIIYYLRNKSNKNNWAICNNYFDGSKWHQSIIDNIVEYEFISPFVITKIYNNITIFYFNTLYKNRQIYSSQFNNTTKNWSKPIQVSTNNNQKFYLNVLQDNVNLYHITYSEMINYNLIINYSKGSFNNNTFNCHTTTRLSEPSNCSFPQLIKYNHTLWLAWVQLNKIYSCYSVNNGILWSKPIIDTTSCNNDFIRYKFLSNSLDDIDLLESSNIFGTYKNNIFFIGFTDL